VIIKHFRVLFACLISIKSPALDIYSFNVSESPLSRHITQPTITSIHSDNRGFLWIGTQHGLYRFDGADYVFFDSDINNRNWIPASDIREISEFRGSVLVATFGGGLLLWDRHAKKFEHLGPKSLGSQRFITHLLSTGSGRIGIVSNEGLSIISYSEDNFNFLKKHSFDLTQILASQSYMVNT
jgi:ligand-binding sensor domain-containing protein